MNTEQVNSVKSSLARILATENIFIQHQPGAVTASFDIKQRILVLPVWQNISNNLYDMLIVHEVGHALDTPFEGWMNGIKDIVKRVHGKENLAAERAIKDFLNVVEDARIDKRQKRRFPGSKRDYIVGYKELFERDFFGLRGREINALGFIDRANVYFKGGSTILNIQFSDEEKKFIKRMENLETFEDVMTLTEEIYAWSKANKEDENHQTIKSKIKVSASGDESEDGDDDDDVYVFGDDDDEFLHKIEKSDQQEDAEDDEDISSVGSDFDDDSDESSDEDSDEKGSPSSGNEGGQSEEDCIPRAETEEAARRNLSSIVMDDDVNYIQIRIPEFHHKNIVEDFDVVIPRLEEQVSNSAPRGWGFQDRTRESVKKDFLDWKNSEKDTISFMVKEFEMRKSATAYSRISVSKTGKLDMNKLHSYQYNDDVFRRLTTLPKGKNHGFVMFLDWSGSMDPQLRNTVKQLLSLTMFCKKVQIPFEVYFFRTAFDHDFNDGHITGTYSRHTPQSRRDLTSSSNPGDLRFDVFKVCNVLSSRMNHTMFNRAMSTLWMTANFFTAKDQLFSTPLNQTILLADKLVNDFRIKNKCEIVSTIFLTDGGSDPINDYVGAGQQLPLKKKGNRFILTDPVSKRTFFLDSLSYYGSERITSIFFEILKERTKSNLIGFFLVNSNKLKHLSNVAYELIQLQSTQDFWKKNGYIGVKSAGYDEYYVIDGTRLGLAYENNLNIGSGMRKSMITKEFIKYAGRKTVNRVLLSNFIKQVATDKKVA